MALPSLSFVSKQRGREQRVELSPVARKKRGEGGGGGEFQTHQRRRAVGEEDVARLAARRRDRLGERGDGSGVVFGGEGRVALGLFLMW